MPRWSPLALVLLTCFVVASSALGAAEGLAGLHEKFPWQARRGQIPSTQLHGGGGRGIASPASGLLNSLEMFGGGSRLHRGGASQGSWLVGKSQEAPSGKKAAKAGSLTSWESMLAGAFAGFVARVVVAPIDLAKIRLQVQKGSKEKLAAGVSRKYVNMVQTLRTVAREEGFRALWKGNGPAQLMVMSFVAVKFASYAKLKELIGDANEAYLGGRGNKAVITMVAGGTAGAMATSVSYPLDLLRTRLASYTGPIVGALERETLTVWRSGGIRAFYRGMPTALVSIIPYIAIQLSTFELLKSSYITLRATIYPSEAGSTKLGMASSTVFGGMAGGASKLITLPLDLCKKREQMDMSIRGFSTFRVMVRVAKEEGVLALWSGGWPSIFKTIPATAITFGVFEVCKSAILLANEEKEALASMLEKSPAFKVEPKRSLMDNVRRIVI